MQVNKDAPPKCVFDGVIDAPKRDNEPRFTCAHGVTVSWTTARKVLKLAGEKVLKEANNES